MLRAGACACAYVTSITCAHEGGGGDTPLGAWYPMSSNPLPHSRESAKQPSFPHPPTLSMPEPLLTMTGSEVPTAWRGHIDSCPLISRRQGPGWRCVGATCCSEHICTMHMYGKKVSARLEFITPGPHAAYRGADCPRHHEGRGCTGWRPS